MQPTASQFEVLGRRAFPDAAFGQVNLDWHEYVKFDDRHLRPAEVDLLIGDYARAKKHLGWEPKIRMKALAELMIDADLALAGK